MKKVSTIFLRAVIVLVGIGAAGLLLWEPRVEGRNAHATLFQTYFHDPFLALVYAGAVPFFVALVQAYKVLGYAGQKNGAFTPAAVRALRTIKYCAIAVIGFVAVEEAFIVANHGSDDPASGVFVGVLIAFLSTVVAVAAAMFERILRDAVDIKSENDLTV
jgi:hypothetical protein